MRDVPAVGAEVHRLLCDFQRLWEVADLADMLAMRMGVRPVRDGDPAETVLGAHRALLVIALRRAQFAGTVASDADPERLVDALLGVYLSRRLAGRDLDGWVDDAIVAVALRGQSRQEGTQRDGS